MEFSPQVENINADVLVIGSGLAGLTAAIEAANIVKNVVVVTRGKAGKSGNTIMARNGMAAVMEEGYDGDSVEKHVNDTLAGGCHINDTAMVKTFAENAGPSIKRLMESGVRFLQENNELVRKGAPGHSCRRFLTVYDNSIKAAKTQGLALTLPLIQAAKRAGVRFIQDVTITDLLVNSDRITGARALDEKVERVWIINSPSVILACGGAGELYPVSTNSAGVNGDGYALARNAGVRLRDMEFVQFHPAFALGRPRMVMSTTPFADGAVLLNKNGERYMERYSPHREMATRDVMARANYLEITAGRGTENGGVYMDFSPIPEETMINRHRDLYAYLQGNKIIEVAPAMHFMMGGVEVDGNGCTSITGLYAAGENAGGLHGANRLAGNALTEAAVFGMITGKRAALKSQESRGASSSPEKELLPHGIASTKSNYSFDYIKKNIRKIMGDKAALVRKGKDLQSAVQELSELKEKILYNPVTGWKELIDYHKTSLMIETSLAIVEAALARKETLGTHYRED